MCGGRLLIIKCCWVCVRRLWASWVFELVVDIMTGELGLPARARKEEHMTRTLTTAMSTTCSLHSARLTWLFFRSTTTTWASGHMRPPASRPEHAPAASKCSPKFPLPAAAGPLVLVLLLLVAFPDSNRDWNSLFCLLFGPKNWEIWTKFWKIWLFLGYVTGIWNKNSEIWHFLSEFRVFVLIREILSNFPKFGPDFRKFW